MRDRSSDPVDDLLVMQAQDGDRRSMEELVRRWQRRLWAHAYRLTGTSDAAWDVTQQAWVAIIKGLGRLGDASRFRAWAYRIVSNKAMDHIASRRPGAQREAVIMSGSARQEHAAMLREALGRLEPEKKALLVLYYLEGLSVSELAFVLRTAEGTVKSRLHAARAEFRRLWRGESIQEARNGQRRRPEDDHR
jgi:RNA polymerase sigma-70 factor (ECF subfamily)